MKPAKTDDPFQPGGAAVFLIKGVSYLEDGQAIECEESFYRSDKYDLAFRAIID